MSFKPLFSRAIAAAPGRLHFAAHSHHLWPDVSHDAQVQAWADAAALADHKWGKVMGELYPAAQAHVASELGLTTPDTISFSGNTHDFIVRIFTSIEAKPVRVLATDGEFHSFRRQMARWVEAGAATLDSVPADCMAARAAAGDHDLIFASQMLFNSGAATPALESLAALARPDGPWVVIDGYHGFMAVPTDLGAVADRIFYLAGGYKYAMAGEGVCFLHAPPGFAPRPTITGWYAAFDDLSLPPGSVGYPPDGGRFLGSTFDPSGLYRFVAVRDMLAREGLTTAVISAHCATLRDRFIAANPLPQLVLLNPPGEQDAARFLAFKGDAAPAMHTALTRADAVTDLRGDVLRIGFGLYQDADDVDALLDRIAGLRL